MEFETANLNHLDTAFALIRSAICEMERCGIRQWDELYPTADDLKQDILNHTLMCAWKDEQLAAVYVLSQECDEEYHRCAWSTPDATACILHRFCVSPVFQHQGIGRDVLKHAEQQARELGYSAMRLDVFTQNPHALRLYEKAGYIQKGTADWRKGRFILMEKVL